MRVEKNFLKKESGAALVIALIIMIVLTVIALASSFTSIFEIKLSGNKRGMTDAFYTADGGVQATLPDMTNFNLDNYTLIPDSGSLPQGLQSEPIDTVNLSPAFSLPKGISFTVPPTVTIYHSTKTGAPRGQHFSATGNYEFSYFIIDSIGKDQMDSSSFPSTCQIREKVVRLIPTDQGGN